MSPATLKVALVNPPYAPIGIPNLGIAVLSARLKAQGFDCKTVYADFKMLDRLPGRKKRSRFLFYYRMSLMPFHPWNEWVFTDVAFPAWQQPSAEEGLRNLDLRYRGRLRKRVLHWLKRYPTPGKAVRKLKAEAAEMIADFCEPLADADVIGLSNTFHQTVPSLAMARYIKEKWPKKIVIMGGANCEGDAGQYFLNEFPHLDAVFSGDADHSLTAYLHTLVDGSEPLNIPGLYYRGADGRAKLSAKPMVVTDFSDALPPDFDDYIATQNEVGMPEDFPLVLPLEASRGCWWGAKSHCTFCGLNSSDMKFRPKAFEQFEAEVQSLVDRYQPRFLIMADNIIGLEYFPKLADSKSLAEKKVDLFFETKANLKREQVASMAKAGVTHIQPGIETFSSPILKLMRKGLTGIQAITLLKYCREYGVLCYYYVLGGFPGEDPAEFAWMQRLTPTLEHLQPPEGVFPINFVRSSPYHQDPASFGIELKRSWFYEHLFPFSEEAKQAMAYYYETDDPPEPEHLPPLRDRLFRWRRKWNAERCTLTWRRLGGDIYIQDRRPNRRRRDYRLSGMAAAAFLALDSPTGVARILEVAEQIRDSGIPAGRPDGEGGMQPLAEHHPAPDFRPHGKEIEIRLTADAGEDRLLPYLKTLEEYGLVYNEKNQWVSLPVAANHVDYQLDWITKGFYFD